MLVSGPIISELTHTTSVALYCFARFVAWGLMSVTTALFIAGCDGDDGAPGPAGPQGPPGESAPLPSI